MTTASLLPLQSPTNLLADETDNDMIDCTSTPIFTSYNTTNGSSSVNTFRKKFIVVPTLLLVLLNALYIKLSTSSPPRRDWNQFWTTIATSSPRNDHNTNKAVNYSQYGTSGATSSPTSWDGAFPQLRPLVISGPSGVGKGTLIDMLVKYYNRQEIKEEPQQDGTAHERMDTTAVSPEQDLELHYPLGFSVSHTTRNPRPGEINGIHYHFTTKDEMLRGIENNEFIEYAQVHGNIYGTAYESVQSVIQQGKICILDIDIQGAMKIKHNQYITTAPHLLFIAPPSMEVLETRLRERGTETEDAIRTRLGNAKKEVEFGLTPGNFDEIIVNNDLNESFLHLRMIVENWYPHLNQVSVPLYDL